MKEIERKRTCSYDNDLIKEVLKNEMTFLEKRDTMYLGDIYVFLSKALDGVESKKDLSDGEIEDIKRIRNLIKGL